MATAVRLNILKVDDVIDPEFSNQDKFSEMNLINEYDKRKEPDSRLLSPAFHIHWKLYLVRTAFSPRKEAS